MRCEDHNIESWIIVKTTLRPLCLTPSGSLSCDQFSQGKGDSLRVQRAERGKETTELVRVVLDNLHISSLV